MGQGVASQPGSPDVAAPVPRQGSANRFQVGLFIPRYAGDLPAPTADPRGFEEFVALPASTRSLIANEGRSAFGVALSPVAAISQLSRAPDGLASPPALVPSGAVMLTERKRDIADQLAVGNLVGFSEVDLAA